MTDACNHLKWDKPDDPAPMRCALGPGHEGDHRPTSHCSEVWATWPNEEGAA